MPHFVLVDCNNFYVSCERLFKPFAEGKPVVVLSNNDGCVISRSQEAKSLGISMCAPFFQIKDFCKKHQVLIYSSNYSLYGDLSQRVMNMLAERAPQIETYSIDEAFLTYPESESCESVFSICLETKKILKKWIGIPTSLGIGPTKTLAKIAVELAKKHPQEVFSLSPLNLRDEVLQKFPIKDIWGVGSGFQAKLNALGIHTALELREADPIVIRKKLGVVGERIVWELRGVSCLPLEQTVGRRNIAYSRSFGQSVKHIDDLAEALSTYIHRACVKLRRQDSCARALCVYLEATLDVKSGSRWQESRVISFEAPTNQEPVMIKAAKRCLSQIFSKKLSYKKCGVILLDLILSSDIVPDLFSTSNPKRQKAVNVVDQINTRFGKNSIFYAAMGIHRNWRMRSEKRSNHYTTCWNELAKAKA